MNVVIAQMHQKPSNVEHMLHATVQAVLDNTMHDLGACVLTLLLARLRLIQKPLQRKVYPLLSQQSATGS